MSGKDVRMDERAIFVDCLIERPHKPAGRHILRFIGNDDPNGPPSECKIGRARYRLVYHSGQPRIQRKIPPGWADTRITVFRLYIADPREARTPGRETP